MDFNGRIRGSHVRGREHGDHRIGQLEVKGSLNIKLFPSVPQIDNNEYIYVMADYGIKIVETSAPSPPPEALVRRIKDLGINLDPQNSSAAVMP